MRTFLLPIMVMLSLGACSNGGADSLPSASVSLYKYAGSTQCTGGGLSLSDMARQLTEAGVQVRSSSCGTDGNMYASMCGMADGRIGIFEVAEAQVQAASSVGFLPLNTLPTASKINCQP